MKNLKKLIEEMKDGNQLNVEHGFATEILPKNPKAGGGFTPCTTWKEIQIIKDIDNYDILFYDLDNNGSSFEYELTDMNIESVINHIPKEITRIYWV